MFVDTGSSPRISSLTVLRRTRTRTVYAPSRSIDGVWEDHPDEALNHNSNLVGHEGNDKKKSDLEFMASDRYSQHCALSYVPGESETPLVLRGGAGSHVHRHQHDLGGGDVHAELGLGG